MKKTFIFGLLAAVLGFSSCCDGDSIIGTTDGDDDVKDVPVAGITLSIPSMDLTIDGDEADATTTLTVSVTPENATNKAVTWSSSDENVATVSAEGIVTAVNEGTATITATAKDGSGKTATCTVTVVKAAPAEDPHLLPGFFSVSATKKVKFTASNLYWDGSDFKFEAKPTDYPTTRVATGEGIHVGHFYWTKTAAASYAASYDDGELSETDKFFADGRDADHKLTVEGISGLYILSADEWTYLLQTRTNAASLYKIGVTVNGNTNCLVIAPDGFTGTLKATYTLDELKTAGLVCLPTAGYFDGDSSVSGEGVVGFYWCSTPYTGNASLAQFLRFDSTNALVFQFSRSYACCLRAVLSEN